LQRHGYDALSCHAAGNSNQGLPDVWQLSYAAESRRAMLVFNIADYIVLDALWRAEGRAHFGIILAVAEWPLGELVRRARLHLDTHTPEAQHNAVFWLA
jgi:hypothetical protein